MRILCRLAAPPTSDYLHMIQDLIPEGEAAELLGMCHYTMRQRRKRGEGPPFIKIARSFYYRPETLRDWVLAKEQPSEPPKGPANPASRRSTRLLRPPKRARLP